jgi:hypothetical protein
MKFRALTLVLAAAVALPVAAPASASAAPYLPTYQAKWVAAKRVKQLANSGGGSYLYHKINYCTRFSRSVVACDYYFEYYDRTVGQECLAIGRDVRAQHPDAIHRLDARSPRGLALELAVVVPAAGAPGR